MNREILTLAIARRSLTWEIGIGIVVYNTYTESSYDAIYNGAHPIEVFPNTVEEYTDAIDCNGKKIFTGHLLKDTNNNIFEVNFYKSSYVLKKDKSIQFFHSLDLTKFKIIGSIHDEFLEEQKRKRRIKEEKQELRQIQRKRQMQSIK